MCVFSWWPKFPTKKGISDDNDIVKTFSYITKCKVQAYVYVCECMFCALLLNAAPLFYRALDVFWQVDYEVIIYGGLLIKRKTAYYYSSTCSLISAIWFGCWWSLIKTHTHTLNCKISVNYFVEHAVIALRRRAAVNALII